MSRDFDGVDDLIDWGLPALGGAAPAALRLAGSMSYACWARFDAFGTDPYENVFVGCGGNGDDYLYYFWLDGNDQRLKLLWTRSGASVDVLGTTTLPVAPGSWHHFGFTRDALLKVARMYFDGVKVEERVYSDNPSGGETATVYTGADPAFPSFNLDGRVQEEATWNFVIGDADMASIGSGARPRAPHEVAGYVSYRPLLGDTPGVEFDLKTGATGAVTGATKAAHHPVWAAAQHRARGTATHYNAAARSERGAARTGFGGYARAERGSFRHLKAYGSAGRGAARQLNSFAALGCGGMRVGYDPYAAAGRGAHSSYCLHGLAGRGAHRSAFETFGRAERGAHAVLSGYALRGRGAFAAYVACGRSERGGHRVANDALARYELYRGVNAAPDLAAAPWQTFATLPFTTPALAAGNTYRFVLRRRNAWGLLSQNVGETAVVVDGSGNPVAAPSPPYEPAAAAAAGGTVLVTAYYDYDADGLSQADSLLVYTRTDGTDPDPSVDTPAVVAMGKADGVAKLEYSTSALAEGTTVKALVRTRRTGTPSVDSTNAGPVVSAVATLLGPSRLSPAGVLQGNLVEQAQQQ